MNPTSLMHSEEYSTAHCLLHFGVFQLHPPKAAMDPRAGFAWGLLWSRRPDWTCLFYLKAVEIRARIRRVNFSSLELDECYGRNILM